MHLDGAQEESKYGWMSSNHDHVLCAAMPETPCVQRKQLPQQLAIQGVRTPRSSSPSSSSPSHISPLRSIDDTTRSKSSARKQREVSASQQHRPSNLARLVSSTKLLTGDTLPTPDFPYVRTKREKSDSLPHVGNSLGDPFKVSPSVSGNF